MKKFQLSITLSTFLVMNLSCSCFVQSQVKTEPTIDSLINKTILKNNIPSMAVGIITKDTIYYGINGVTKSNGKVKVTLKSKYHLGSTTKAFVGFLAMEMHEKGLLNIDNPIFDAIPNLKNSKNQTFHKISLADLLSHQAYVQPYQRTLEFEKLQVLKGSLTNKREAFSKFVLSEPAVDKFTYSNAGYIIASHIIERAVGKNFEHLLKNSLNNLGLSYIVGFPNRKKIDDPWGHWIEGNKYQALPPNHYYNGYDYSLAAGNMSMDIINFSIWVKYHLLGVSGKPKGISSNGYKRLHFDRKKYSYGWGNRMTKNGKESMHSGSSGAFFSDIVIYHDKGIAIAILMNSAQSNQIADLDKLHKRLFSLYNVSK